MTRTTPSHKPRAASFCARPLGLELVIAGLLLGLVGAWQVVRRGQLMPLLSWSFCWLPVGLLATVLPLLMIPLLELPVARRWIGLRCLHDNVESVLVPLFGKLGWFDIVMLSTLAGVSEEVFFRGMLQQEMGLLVASVAFGLLHTVSVPYMIWATIVGLYLGYLVNVTHNLWPAIVAHLAIDVVGLCYLRFIVAPRCGKPAGS